jgi:hypothetical protein
MRGIQILATGIALTWAVPASADTVTDWWVVANRLWLAGQATPGPRTPDAERASRRLRRGAPAAAAAPWAAKMNRRLPNFIPGRSQAASAASHSAIRTQVEPPPVRPGGGPFPHSPSEASVRAFLAARTNCTNSER